MKRLFAAIAMSTLLFASCTGGDTTNGDDMITLGWVGPLSGDISNIGNASKQAVEMAVAEMNEAGGIDGKKVQVIFEDGACESRKASSAANKLVNVDKVSAIIGGLCSSESLAAIAVAGEKGIPMVSPASTSPDLTDAGKYFFRVVPSDEFQGKRAAQFVKEDLGATKIGVLYAVTDYTKGLADAFTDSLKDMGVDILVEDTFQQKSRDLRTQLTKMKDAGVEHLYFSTYTEAGVVGLKQMTELGFEVQIIGSDAFGDAKMIEADGAEGAIYLTPKTATNDDFNASFMEANDREDVPVYAMQSYDAAKLLMKHIADKGADSENIRKGLAATLNFEGVSGYISFDENGDLASADYDIFMVKDGKSVPYAAE